MNILFQMKVWLKIVTSVNFPVCLTSLLVSSLQLPSVYAAWSLYASFLLHKYSPVHVHFANSFLVTVQKSFCEKPFLDHSDQIRYLDAHFHRFLSWLFATSVAILNTCVVLVNLRETDKMLFYSLLYLYI